jgi:phosphoglycerate dehydrogenase-like enzyme
MSSEKKLRVLAIAPRSFPALERLASLHDVEVVADDDLEALRNHIGGAEVILLAPRYGSMITDLWLGMRNVKWIHSLGAGVENLPFDLLRPSTIVVTNSRGLYADALGEFAVAAMLWFARDLRRLIRQPYGRSPEQVYPTGVYPQGGGFYGTDVVAPIPAIEQTLNPRYTGCASTGA